MQTEEEYQDFCRWYEKASVDEQVGCRRVYGRIGVVQPNGRMKKTRLKVGTLVLAPDGIAFLRAGHAGTWWAVILLVLGFLVVLALLTVLAVQTGRTPIFLAAVPVIGMYWAIAWWARRPIDVGNPAVLHKAAADAGSAFVPLSRITWAGPCTSRGWANPDHLHIKYHDAEDNRCELIVGDLVIGSVHFDIHWFEEWLEQARTNR